MAETPQVQASPTAALTRDVLDEVRALLTEAFDGDFDDHDFTHCLGGTHLLLRLGGVLVGHVAVVPRRLYVAEERLSCGYVEAVAVSPSRQGKGLGRLLMEAADLVVRGSFEVGALSTGAPGFYERLGWIRWQGPSHVVDGDFWVRTPDEDDGVMVLDWVAPGLDARARIAVDRRVGDSW